MHKAASTFAEAFDSLLDAYQRIGEQIPLLSQYETYFSNYPIMRQVLRLQYEDILNFHWKAMKYFKQRSMFHKNSLQSTLLTCIVWKQLFRALWRSFNTQFGEIIRNLEKHRLLIESQASITQFAEILSTRESTETVLENQRKEEIRKQRELVYQWLSAANYEGDQETYTKTRRAYPGTGKWLLRHNRFHSWFDPDFCSNPLVWLTGIPGAGELHSP